MTRRAYAVQVWNGKRWAKPRDVDVCRDAVNPETGEVIEGSGRRRAERHAESRSNPALRRPSSTEGLPHRVVEVEP